MAETTRSARQDQRPWRMLDVVIFELDDSSLMAGVSPEG